MKSEKYPGWLIEEQTIGLDANGVMQMGYFLTRPDWEALGIRYAILVAQYDGEWKAESRTWANRHGEFITTDKSQYGKPVEVIKEIERRAEYHIAQRTKRG